MAEMWMIGLVTMLLSLALAGHPALGFAAVGFCLVMTALFCEK